MHKTKLTASAIALMTVTTAAFADRTATFTDRAPVVSSTPIYQQVNEPRRECWAETVGSEYRSADRSYGGAIIGGVVGGLLGNTLGKGNGRTAAAAVGAVTGAMVGDNIDNDGYRYNRQPRQVERCRSYDNYRQIITGYNVVYRYQGRDMTTTLPYDPGRYLTLNVNVMVAENQSQSRGYWQDRD